MYVKFDWVNASTISDVDYGHDAVLALTKSIDEPNKVALSCDGVIRLDADSVEWLVERLRKYVSEPIA